jgi:cytochrome c biogenesis protein CcdA
LWLIGIVLIVVSAFYARAAFQLWQGNLDFRNPNKAVSIADVPEPRLRVFAASTAAAIAISSCAGGAILAAVAEAVGSSVLGGIILGLGTFSGVASLVFAAIAISIYFTNKPSRFVPPALRDRNLQR